MNLTDLLPWLNVLLVPLLGYVVSIFGYVVSLERRLTRLEAFREAEQGAPSGQLRLVTKESP